VREIKQFYKEYHEDDEAVYIGKQYSGEEVTKLLYHEPQGEGDAHYVDVYIDDKLTERVFRPDNIEFF